MKPFETLDVEEDKIRKIRKTLLNICKEKNLKPLDLTQGNPVGKINAEYGWNSIELIEAEIEGHSNSNAYCSSVGHPAYLEAVAELEKKVNQLDFTSEHILAVPGAAVGVSTLLYGLSKEPEQGEVIILAPFFPPYTKYINHNKLTPKIIDFANEPVAIDMIGSAINDDTRAIIINSPNNPSGQIYSKRFLRKLGEILDDNEHVLAISDEPYRNVVLPHEEWNSVIKNLDYQNAAVVYSFSKEGRIAGSRIGYIALHPDFPEHKKVISALANSLPERGIVQAHTREQFALSKCELPLDVDWSNMLNLMMSYMEDLITNGHAILPARGGMFVCMSSKKYDGTELHEKLLEQGVGTVPGIAFGIENYVRLAICSPDAKYKDEFLERLDKI